MRELALNEIQAVAGGTQSGPKYGGNTIHPEPIQHLPPGLTDPILTGPILGGPITAPTGI